MKTVERLDLVLDILAALEFCEIYHTDMDSHSYIYFKPGEDTDQYEIILYDGYAILIAPDGRFIHAYDIKDDTDYVFVAKLSGMLSRYCGFNW